VIQSQRKNTARDVIKEGTLEFAQPKLPPRSPSTIISAISWNSRLQGRFPGKIFLNKQRLSRTPNGKVAQ